jgi:dihydroorotate dehydrogenase
MQVAGCDVAVFERALFSDSELPPLTNAAGTVKTVDQVKAFVGAPFPAVLLGSYTAAERPGNDGRTFFDAPFGALNSMGLPGPDVYVWRQWVREAAQLLHDDGKDLWVSVAGFNPPEYRYLAEIAIESGADAVELNLGCPNVWDEGEQKPIASLSVEQTALVVEAVQPLLDHKVGVKLSPILDAVAMAQIDRLLSDAGFAFITVINTVPNCFAFAPDGESAISFGSGLAGMSGPAVKWLALGQIVAHRGLLPETPIVGVGGITCGRDLWEFARQPVGADACQVGTAFWQRGIKAMTTILEEFAELLEGE